MIYKPANQKIPNKFLENAYRANKDGSGICIATGTELIVEKSKDWTHEDIIRVLEANPDLPALVHFRWTTHGGNSDANTHPFSLKGGWAAAHNGVIQIPIWDPTKSDTREFLDRYVKPLIHNGVNLDNLTVIEQIGKVITTANKMAFLHFSGRSAIVNESVGNWDDGVWYSNYGYKSYATTYSGGTCGFQGNSGRLDAWLEAQRLEDWHSECSPRNGSKMLTFPKHPDNDEVEEPNELLTVEEQEAFENEVATAALGEAPVTEEELTGELTQEEEDQLLGERLWVS